VCFVATDWCRHVLLTELVTVGLQAEDEGREAFLSLAGADGEIDAYELQNILNQVFIQGNTLCLGFKGFSRQKNGIFHSSKSANFVRNLATNPEFCQLTMHYFSLSLKFCQISSKINIVVILSVFRQK